jgi:mannose-6-phosphate isomerase-like protein (cupin superfamily)
MISAGAVAQSTKSATYITAEQVKAVNATPGIDKQIVIVDVGKINEAIGVIHRGPAAGMLPGTGEPCGDKGTAPPAGQAISGITHDHQTETYVITSGGGTLVTGGRIINGRKSAPDSEITKLLTGVSCSGAIAGDDVVKRTVKAGDVVIIPAGVPHGWTDITDHVDYLNVRADPDRVLPAGYVHPAIKR